MNITKNETNALGAMSPADALEYMKTSDNLVIIDTATAREYEEEHFEGAIHIHYSEMNDRYGEIPENSTVLLHCRLGMVVPRAYEVLLAHRPDLEEVAYIDGAPLFDEYNEWMGGKAQSLLGGISPNDALEYMKTTPGLIVVEVNAPEWKLSTGFMGAMYIPYTEMWERCDEIPENHPVMLHCGGGIVSVEAYEILKETRSDIPQLSYIAGAPPVRAYNEWVVSETAYD